MILTARRRMCKLRYDAVRIGIGEGCYEEKESVYPICVALICIVNRLAVYSENLAGVGSEQRSRRSRHEERGVSLDKLSPDEVVEILKGAQDRIMRRKAAKVIGDRSLDSQNRFTDAEKNVRRGTVSKRRSIIQ
jgi:hypothetical protein